MSFLSAERNTPAEQLTKPSDPEPRLDQAFHYHLRALREPSVLPRVLEMFALRDLIPHHVACWEDDGGLVVDVHVRGLETQHARHLAQRMRNIVPVSQVALELTHD